MKTCKGCGETKPREAFGKDKRGVDGLAPRCRDCRSAADKVRRDERMRDPNYRARVNEKAREWNRKNPGVSAAKTQRWKERNPEKAKQSAAASRKKLQKAGYHREWYRKNIDKRREDARKHMAESRRKYPEAERARKARYRKNNLRAVRMREKEKTYSRRAKMPYSEDTAEFMEFLLTLPCYYCGSREKITIDHVIPLSRGGLHMPENLVAACWTCNCSKGAKRLSEWPGPPSQQN